MTRSQQVGFRVFTKIPRPPRELVEALGQMETTYLTDAMNRFGGMEGNIRPADPTMRLAGPALTVRVPPGDNLMVYKAFEIAQPGDVMVIEARGFVGVAQWGDLVSMMGIGLKLAGMVTDGSLRDLKGIVEIGFPVFAQPYLAPKGDMKDGPGEINVPIAVGGVPVLPGDIVVGDSHGVVVVPRQDAAVVLRKAKEVVAAEQIKIAEFRAGKFIPAGLDDTLAKKGCEMLDAAYEDER
jgi:regulator of RNase E activity RraA